MQILLIGLFMYLVVAVAEDMLSDKEEEEEIYEVPRLDVIGSFSTMLKVLSYIMHTMANLGSGLGNLLHSFSHTAHPGDYPHHVVQDYNTSVNTTHFSVGTQQNAMQETPSNTSTVLPLDPDTTEEILMTTPVLD